jgi:Nif-specific regulatory protein
MALAYRVRAAADLTTSLMPDLRRLQEFGVLAEAHRVLGIDASYAGHGGLARDHFETAIAVLNATAETPLVAEMMQGLCAAAANAGASDTEEIADRAIRACRAVGHEIALAKALMVRGAVATRDKRFREAERDFREAISITESRRNLELKTQALRKLMVVRGDCGDLTGMLAAGRQAFEETLYLGASNLLPQAAANLLEALHLVGRNAEAVAFGRDAIERWGESTDPYFQIYGRLMLAQVLLECAPPDVDGCRALIERAIEEARRYSAPRPLATALLTEIERRVICREPRADGIEAEFSRLASREAERMDRELLVRRALAESERLLAEGSFAEVLPHAESAARSATQFGLESLAARAHATAGAAWKALHKHQEAARERQASRSALLRVAERISDPDDRRSFLARPVFSAVMASDTGEPNDGIQLRALYDMIRALNSETDPEALLPAILDMALGAVHAERGMILLTDPATGGFSVRLSRNLEKETASDAEAYSRGIAAQAGEGQSILALDAGHDERFKDLKSVSLYRIRSLMCVPLRSRGRIVGTVYLDSRREGRMFSQEDLRFVEAFADHAALALENARARARLEEENRRLRAVAGERTSFASIIGRSQPMQRVFDLLQTIAKSELPVLVLGESGTGKELVAKAIHFHGPRKAKVFLSENCAALPESLLESTLFGHVRGAFTGADRDRAGLFEQADGGTLFLDEVGDMSPTMQARLLRVLQEGEVRRVGDERVVHVDVRVIAATNKDLEKEIREGRFREDLFYRLNVLSVPLPPLRERPGDIALLTASLVERIAKERGRATPRVDNEVLDLLERYSWPGNVRQLENVLQRLSLLAGDGAVTLSVLESDENLRRTFLEDRAPAVPVLSLAKNEEEQIRRALEETAGNRDRAARLLGISRATVYRKIKEYGIR